MIRALLMSAVLVGSVSASANELDNEGQVTNQALKGTVVLRIDTRDNSMAMVQTSDVAANPEQAVALVQSASFSPVPQENVRAELDRDGGASSWYWCYNPYQYSYGNYYSYNYYGNSYTPYYNYNYGNYNYYYYSSYNYGYGNYYGNYGGNYGYGFGRGW